MNGESDEGGFDEFRLFCPTWRFNSATSSPTAAHHRPQFRVRRPKLRVLGSKLLVGGTTVGGHEPMINKIYSEINSPRRRPDQVTPE